MKILPVIIIPSSLLVCPKHRFRTGYICYTMLLLLHSIEINLIFVLSTWISKQYGFSHDILYVNLAVDQTLLYTDATIVVVYLCSRVGVGPMRPPPFQNWHFQTGNSTTAVSYYLWTMFQTFLNPAFWNRNDGNIIVHIGTTILRPFILENFFRLLFFFYEPTFVLVKQIKW